MGNAFSIDKWREVLTNSLQQFGTTVGHLVPAILGALLILSGITIVNLKQNEMQKT